VQTLVETHVSGGEPARAVVREGRICVDAGRLTLHFAADAPRLLEVSIAGKPVSFTAGPDLIGSSAGAWKLTHRQETDSLIVEGESTGDLKHVRWTAYPTGWLRLDYDYALQGEFDLFGVGFDYPEGKMKAMRFLGEGPYRVWKNRLKGGTFDVWSNTYKNDIPGMTWSFPEFKGYYRNWRWVVFTTAEGEITIVNGTPELLLGVYRPNDGPAPANTKLSVPQTGIAFLHGIPTIGTKFNKPEVLGPESRKNQASGVYRGAVWFHFDGGE